MGYDINFANRTRNEVLKVDWQSWDNIDSSAYMKISYISQAYQNSLHVKELIENYITANPNLGFVDTSEGMQTQPLPDYMNAIETNLNVLENNISWSVNRLEGRTWLGEHLDNPTFNYSDVNRWFHDLLEMKLRLDSIPLGWRRSGTFSCGNNYRVQLFRR